MEYTIYQNYRKTNSDWSGWVATRHVNLSDVAAANQVVEIQAEEQELRAKYPGTEAIYEVRPVTANLKTG